MEHLDEALDIFGEVIQYNGWQTDIETFIHLFGAAFPNPTYTKLMAIDQGRMGYQDYFQSLVSAGKLPQD